MNDSIMPGDGPAEATRKGPTIGDQGDLRDRGHALTDTLRRALLALLSSDTV